MVTPDDIISNIIRYHVVRLREALGWTQENLAERMGVKFQYVSQKVVGALEAQIDFLSSIEPKKEED